MTAPYGNSSISATFVAGTLLTRCSFANLDRFLSETLPLIEEHPSDDPLTAIAEAANSIVARASPDNHDEIARAEMVAHDIKKVVSTLKGTDLGELPTSFDPDSMMPEIQNELALLGLDLGIVRSEVVDRFPAPFAGLLGNAFCPDSEDERRYGVPRGMYFRQDRLRPFFSEALLCHESIHVVPGMRQPELLAMGLEEGIADVLGSVYLATKFVPLAAVENALIYGRHGVGRPHMWTLYLEHGRQAALLYRRIGLRGLAELLVAGRGAIHETEAGLLTGEFPSFRSDAIHDDQTTQVLDSVMSAFTGGYSVTPLARKLLKASAEGEALEAIADRAGIPGNTGVAVLNDVANRTNLIMLDGPRIAYSNSALYFAAEADGAHTVIRYE